VPEGHRLRWRTPNQAGEGGAVGEPEKVRGINDSWGALPDHGANGCAGAWTPRHLVEEGCEVVTFDLGEDPRRLRVILDHAQPAQVTGATATSRISRETFANTKGDN
jgi:hypothetical protein